MECFKLVLWNFHPPDFQYEEVRKKFFVISNQTCYMHCQLHIKSFNGFQVEPVVQRQLCIMNAKRFKFLDENRLCTIGYVLRMQNGLTCVYGTCCAPPVMHPECQMVCNYRDRTGFAQSVSYTACM
jgi:hypothetical protein